MLHVELAPLLHTADHVLPLVAVRAQAVDGAAQKEEGAWAAVGGNEISHGRCLHAIAALSRDAKALQRKEGPHA